MIITSTPAYHKEQIDIFPTEEKAREYLAKSDARVITEQEAKKLNPDCLYHYLDRQGHWCYTIAKTRATIKTLTVA
jgi:hypothetical protein